MNDFASMTGWVGILVFAGGLYCLYACAQMKFKGIINENILLNKEFRFKKCKDKDAYIREMFPTFLLFSILTTACGAIDMMNTFLYEMGVVYFISLILFILGFILFMVKSKKCKDKYY